jgi:hypothetical protein
MITDSFFSKYDSKEAHQYQSTMTSLAKWAQMSRNSPIRDATEGHVVLAQMGMDAKKELSEAVSVSAKA